MRDAEEDEYLDETSTGSSIKRSFASSDIAALTMETNSETEDGFEGSSNGEPEEPLPPQWIEEFSKEAKIQTHRWLAPSLPNDRLRLMFRNAIKMCQEGRADGTFDQFVNEVVSDLLRKYVMDDNIAEWNHELLVWALEICLSIVRMFRYKIANGAGSRDVPPVLFELMHLIFSPGNRFHGSVQFKSLPEDVINQAGVDLTNCNEFINSDHPHDERTKGNIWLWMRWLIVAFAHDGGFDDLFDFYERNVTKSTSIEELGRFIKPFVCCVNFLSNEVRLRFISIVSHSVETLEQTLATEGDGLGVKNHRTILTENHAYFLYLCCRECLSFVRQLNSDFSTHLEHFRFKFLLKLLVEAPFSARMSAIDMLGNMVLETANPQRLLLREPVVAKKQLMEWMEEERAIDLFTRDNLHNSSYVDRLEKVLNNLLQGNMFSPSDLSTLWEAQRGKHDVIQRNLAELIVRIVREFDNDLIESLFHKIQAGWLDGGTRERAMLIDIMRRVGEQELSNESNECCLVDRSLHHLWRLVHTDGLDVENEVAALTAHSKLLEIAYYRKSDIDEYALLCAEEIVKNNGNNGIHAQIGAVHLPAILGLYPAGDDDDCKGGSPRQILICSLEQKYSVIRALCTNIVSTVHSGSDSNLRRSEQIHDFLMCLSFILDNSRQQLQLVKEQASELWEALVDNPLDPDDRIAGFRFFAQLVSSDNMDRNAQADFFKSYVIKVPPKLLNDEGFECFETFFKMVNEREETLDDNLADPHSLHGSSYVWSLIQEAVYHVAGRAISLWVNCLLCQMEKANGSVHLSHRLSADVVNKITEKYDEMKSIRDVTSPDFERTKQQTLRCIDVLVRLFEMSDRKVMVSRRQCPPLGKAAAGRPCVVTVYLSKREVDSLPYYQRGCIRSSIYDEWEFSYEVHDNISIQEIRQKARKSISDKMQKLSRDSRADMAVDTLILINKNDGMGSTVRFEEYKNTLADLQSTNEISFEVRLERSSPRGSSPSSSTSTSDWPLSGDDEASEKDLESRLPSVALSCDNSAIEKLIQAAPAPLILTLAFPADSSDTDVSSRAFKILTLLPKSSEILRHVTEHIEEGKIGAFLRDSSPAQFLYTLMHIEIIVSPRDEPGSVASQAWALEYIPPLVRLLDRNELIKRPPHFRTMAVSSLMNSLRIASLAAMMCIYKDQKAEPMRSLLCKNHYTQFLRKQADDSMRYLSLNQKQMEGTIELMKRNAVQAIPILSNILHAVCEVTTKAPSAYHHEEDEEPLLDVPLLETDPWLAEPLATSTLHVLLMMASMNVAASMVPLGLTPVPADPHWARAIVVTLLNENETISDFALSTMRGVLEYMAWSHSRTLLDDPYQEEGLGLEAFLIGYLLDAMALSRSTDKFCANLNSLVINLIRRISAMGYEVPRRDDRIAETLRFIELAREESESTQMPFPEDTYLQGRLEVFAELLSSCTMAEKERMHVNGGHLSERFITDFVFPSGGLQSGEGDEEKGLIPRSATSQMELVSSSSLFDLQKTPSLPRSVSALPLAARRVAICGGEGSQKAVFQCLTKLAEQCPRNQLLTHATIESQLYSSPWEIKHDFEYMPHHVLRGAGNLVGLKNGGATCYMNSIFQQLFMVEEVREAVLNAPIPEEMLMQELTPSDIKGPHRGKYAVRILAAVQTLFAHLLGSELESYKPADFWKVFNFKPNGESVNVREQQDAVEFHNMVTDLIDEGLKKIGCEAVCQKTFGGFFADEKICKDCPHRYTKEERFESLSVDVRSHNNLGDSLKEYVKGDVLENDNAYHCEECDAKVKAIKRMSLSTLPEVLIVQLKRFDFDWEKETSVKFNDYFSFPFELDIQPYTVEGLEKLERGERLEVNKDCEYCLRGVVVHSGQAQGGHYTSFIRARETGKWFKFDDNDVTEHEATEAEARSKWFGGDNDNDRGTIGRMRKRARMTWWNAYMLFYERKETANRYTHGSKERMKEETKEEDTETDKTGDGMNGLKQRTSASMSPVSRLHRHFSSLSLSGRIRIPPRLEEMLREGNRRVLLERVQYSKQYFHWIHDVVFTSMESAKRLKEGGDIILSEQVALAGMKTMALFLTYNGLYASNELKGIPDEGMGMVQNCAMDKWVHAVTKLTEWRDARLWLVTHVLFHPEMAATFLFAPNHEVRQMFGQLIEATVHGCLLNGDDCVMCRRTEVFSQYVTTLSSHFKDSESVAGLLIFLLNSLPKKYLNAFRTQSHDYYRLVLKLAEKDDRIMDLMIEKGLFSSLLRQFPSSGSMGHRSDLSSLENKDPALFEYFYRIVCSMLRKCPFTQAATPNPWQSANPIASNRVTDLNFVRDFYESGYSKMIQHLIITFIRKSHNPAWATEAVLFLSFNNFQVSITAMESIFTALVREHPTEQTIVNVLHLLKAMVEVEDDSSKDKISYLFHKVPIPSASIHQRETVVGIYEMKRLPSPRMDIIIRVLVVMLESAKGLSEFFEEEPNAVRSLLKEVETVSLIRMGQLPSPPDLRPSDVPSKENTFHRFHAWYMAHPEGGSVPSSSVESMEGGPVAVDLAPHVRYPMGGQLSPSTKLAGLSLTGEKRPYPSEDDSERKRSIGEEKIWYPPGATLKSPSSGTAESTASMDDSSLLMQFSSSSIAHSPPSAPPPSYDQTMASVPDKPMDLSRPSPRNGAVPPLSILPSLVAVPEKDEGDESTTSLF